MSQTIDLRQLERKVHRESLQDGLTEIMIGALMYLCGILIADPKIVAIYVVYLVFLPRALLAAKQRITYPRLGQVVLQHGKPRPLVTAAFLYLVGTAALLAAALALSGRLATPDWYRWSPAWLGLCLAGAFWYLYSKSGSLRYVVYGFAVLAGGVVVASIRLPSAKDYVAVYLICIGALSALTGAITLARFLRSHPLVVHEVPDDDSNG